MRDIMYEIPSDKNIQKCIITKDTVQNGAEPKLVMKEPTKVNKPKTATKKVKEKTSETA